MIGSMFNVGDSICVRYAKTPETPKTYYGTIEKMTDKIILIKRRDGSFRSFSREKIFGIIAN